MHESPRDASVPVLVIRRDGQASEPSRDALVAEEPFEIRLREGADGETLSFVVTMRTPGDDEDLAVGLLFGEGVIDSIEDVLSLERPSDPRVAPELVRNVAIVNLSPGRGLAERLPRRETVMGSACGVCGRTSIEDVMRLAARSRARAGERSASEAARLTIGTEVLTALPETLKARQRVFAATGGLHASALFEADGTPVVVREDVGRHNATDKAVGSFLRARRPPPPILLVSGRLGFEIAQKAALAGIQLVAAVSAPTSLAVELAEETGMTLVGFLRGERFNVYTHPERVSTR